jgi:pilus assembly protein TadC
MGDFLTIGSINNYFFVFIKILFILFAFINFIYSLIIAKQVNSMSKNITDTFNPILVIFSYIHITFSVVLILTMFVL